MSLKETLLDSLEHILLPSPTVFITGALIVVLIPILLHLLIARTSPYTSPPQILLLGPPASGKTALTTLLERPDNDGGPSPTHTSQTAHSVELTASADAATRADHKANARDTSTAHTKFLLLDTPGHPKLRQQNLARLAPAALESSKTKAVVFVLDASSIAADPDVLTPTAAYLHDVLLALQKRTANIKTSKIPAAIPVLVAANKMDLFTALPAALVRANLEAEISRIRVSRSKGLLDSGVGVDEMDTEDNDDWLGSYGTEKFSFDQMMEFNVYIDVIGGNVSGDGPGVDRWWKWIADRI